MKKFFLTTLAIIIVGIFVYLGIYVCPLNYIFGIPCPMCGMTRALLSVLKLNIKESLYYHALWPIVILVGVLYILEKINIVRANIKQKNLFLVTISAIFISYYLYRHLNHSDIVLINIKGSLLYKKYQFMKHLFK